MDWRDPKSPSAAPAYFVIIMGSLQMSKEASTNSIRKDASVKRRLEKRLCSRLLPCIFA